MIRRESALAAPAVVLIAASFATLLGLLAAARPAVAAETGDAARDAGTLDATTIEGEIPLPQVWFFSSREQIVHADRYHFVYLKTFIDLENELELPLRIRPASEGRPAREGP